MFSCDVLYALGTGLDTNGLKPTLTAKLGDLQLDLGIEKPDISIGLMNTMGFVSSILKLIGLVLKGAVSSLCIHANVRRRKVGNKTRE